MAWRRSTFSILASVLVVLRAFPSGGEKSARSEDRSGIRSQQDTTAALLPDKSLFIEILPSSTHLITSQIIRDVPVRGLDEYLKLVPGVTYLNNENHVRGGRSGELRYQLNGFSITNPFNNLPAISVIPEAIEEVEVLSGVPQAKFGWANSGQVLTTMRRGTQKLEIFGGYETDDFVSPGSKFLGTVTSGARTAVLTVGGPVPLLDGMTFFAAGELAYRRNRQPMFLAPFDFNLVTDINDARGEGSPLPGPVSVREDYLPGNTLQQNTIQGNFHFQRPSLALQVTGGYQFEEQPGGSQWPYALERTFNSRRNPRDETRSGFLSLDGTFELGPSTRIHGNAGFLSSAFQTLDPDFGTDWRLFSDSAANAAIGYGGFRTRWGGPYGYSVILGFNLLNEFAPNDTYSENRQNGWLLNFDIDHRFTDDWRVQAGGSVESWTMRLFTVRNIHTVMSYLYPSNGRTPSWFADEQYKRWLFGRYYIHNYGYTWDGVETDDSQDGPFTPRFVSLYASTSARAGDLTVDLGLRYERYSLGGKVFADPRNPPLTLYTTQYSTVDAIDESQLVDRPAENVWLPRLRIRYTMGGATLFGGFGASAQMPPLDQILASIPRTIYTLLGEGPYRPPVGFYAKPERVSQYEAGITGLRLGPLSFSGTFYRKSYSNPLAIRKTIIGDYWSYNTYTNDDRATAQGLEIVLETKRMSGLAARLAYALSSALGTASRPDTWIGAVENPTLSGAGYPPLSMLTLEPLDFQQTQRARLWLDYRTGREGESILSGIAATVLVTFSGGHPYTRYQPLQAIGQANPWEVGVGALADPRYAYPAESVNNSRTPAYFSVDLSVSKTISIASFDLVAFLHVINLLNTRQIINVYPETGSAGGDGWLTNDLSAAMREVPGYEDFYRAINQQNRWAYMEATGLDQRGEAGIGPYDLYGQPRQVRIGLRAIW